MKNTYLILAHDNIEQLVTLVNALDYQDTNFFIHIDAKSKIARMPQNFSKRKNIFFVARVKVYWGGYSQIEATLKLLKAAYNHYNKSDKVYFHLISGMDFPIKSNHSIVDFLNNSYGVQYLEYNKLPYNGWAINGGIDRVKYYWYMDDMSRGESYKLYLVQKELNITNRNYTTRQLYFGGSQWWSITIDCAKYILARADKVVPKFKQVFCADEIFFHTLVMRSKKFEVIKNNLRYIDWHSGPDYPRLLDMADVKNLCDSDCLFTRKIDSRKSPDLIEYLLKKTKL